MSAHFPEAALDNHCTSTKEQCAVLIFTQVFYDDDSIKYYFPLWWVCAHLYPRKHVYSRRCPLWLNLQTLSVADFSVFWRDISSSLWPD